MTNWKLTLAYDGSPYRGWQIQPNLPTVQGLLSDAIHRTTGERVLPQGSGRTDAGVHALAQVASFSLSAPIPAANLHRALNRCLPPSIRVLSVEPVPPTFHARHSALRKTYEYRIFPLRALSLEPRTSNLIARPLLNLVGISSAPPSSPQPSGPVPGRSIWPPSTRPPRTSSARTTSPPSPPQTPTFHRASFRLSEGAGGFSPLKIANGFKGL